MLPAQVKASNSGTVPLISSSAPGQSTRLRPVLERSGGIYNIYQLQGQFGYICAPTGGPAWQPSYTCINPLTGRIATCTTAYTCIALTTVAPRRALYASVPASRVTAVTR